MNLSFSTLACPAWSLERIIEAARANGIRGIDFRGIADEIDITTLPQFTYELDETLATLRGAGLEMPCLNTSVTLITPAPERWQMMLEECQGYAQLARRTGTRYLRVFGGAVPRELTREEARQMGRRHLRQLIRIARPHGCQVLLETHDHWTISDQVLELLEPFEPIDVGVLWDIEHPWRRGEPPEQTTRNLRPFIRHVHVKDSVRVEDRNEPRLLGEGELPLAECIGTLRAIDYTGWLCLETEKRWHAEGPEPEQSIPQFAGYMRKLLS